MRILFIVTLILVHVACSQKVEERIEYVDRPIYTEKVVTKTQKIAVSGDQEPPKEIIRLPKTSGISQPYDLIKKLLSSGFPGSRQSKPLVPVSRQKILYDSDWFKQLDNAAYIERYLDSRYDTSGEVAVNIDLLRKDLVHNKIIAKFGL